MANLATAGSTVVFEIVVDDYAEVWVDGRFPIALGQAGGQLIKGFNAPNRVVVTRDAVPGQRIQLAVFGANGPLSNPPGNFVWIRSATLDFYKKGRVGRKSETKAEVKRVDPRLDAIVPSDLTIEKLADGFVFTEGPVWVPEGYLLFSDPNANTIISPDGTHLGTIVGPEHPHNLTWGDADGRTLYLTAQTGLYRVRLKIPGVRPGGARD